MRPHAAPPVAAPADAAQASLVEVAADAPLDVREVRVRIERWGFALVRGLGRPPTAAPMGPALAPTSFAGRPIVERLLGERPLLTEVQTLRPVPGARSFAGSSVHTPLHTDSQDFLGVAPAVQVLFAERPAKSGGETTLLDTHAVLANIAQEDPALFAALFEAVRAIPFYFGQVHGPTVALKRGHLVVTHAPMDPEDAVGRAFAAFVARRTPMHIAPVAGDLLLVDNHRMLHGRTAFEDPARRLVRTLAWLRAPLAEHAALRAHAARLAHAEDARPMDLPPALQAVLDLLAGDSPAVVASREGVAEATLYPWRNAAVEAAWRALVASGAR